MNQRAILYKPVADADGGGEDIVWTEFVTVWAALAAASTGETVRSDAARPNVRYRIEMRRRGDVAAGQRLAIGTRVFDILAVEDAGPAAQTITLFCEANP